MRDSTRASGTQEFVKSLCALYRAEVLLAFGELRELSNGLIWLNSCGRCALMAVASSGEL